VEVSSWEGRAREKKQDAGVGVEKRVKKNGGHEAILCSVDTCESGAEEGERDEGGPVKMDSAEGEGGEPLGLGDGKAGCEPRKESATKEDFFPDGGDDESVGEEGEEGFSVAGFKEAGHGGLGFERKMKS
jgi:hypothetical protein